MNENDNIFEMDDLFVEDTTDTEMTDTEESGEAAQTETKTDAETPTAEEKASESADTIEYVYDQAKTPLDRKAVEKIAESLGMDANSVVATLQKGANYDRLITRNEEANKMLKRVAEVYKTTPDKLNEAMDAAQAAAARMRYARELKAANPDAPDTLVQETAALRAQQEQAARAEARRQTEAAETEARNRPWVEFFKNHPELNPETLPAEVASAYGTSTSPNEAYMAYQMRQMQLELQTLKKSEENKEKAIGSVSGEVGANTKDPFEEAFDSVFR